MTARFSSFRGRVSYWAAWFVTILFAASGAALITTGSIVEWFPPGVQIRMKLAR